MNGRLYRDGEVFQPSCKIQCHCLDGGFTCIPLCQEDVRLPTPDCPYPRRVEIPGKCCPEWICEAQDQHLLRDARAGKMQGSSGAGRDAHGGLWDGPFTPGCETSAGDTHTQGCAFSITGHSTCLQPPFPPPVLPCSRRGGVPSAAIPVPGVGHGVERLLGHLRAGLRHPRLQPKPPLPAGDTAAALHGQTLPGPARGLPGGESGLGEPLPPGNTFG